MELDRAAAVLRTRRPWEGLDLGFALGRTWFGTLWPLWLIGLAPMAVLTLALAGARADIWLVAVWWMKPLYEAPLVYWASRAFFGEPLALSDLRQILRASWTRRLLPFLLWRRLGANRAFTLPIALLEGLHGKAARQRRRVLSDGDGAAAWLTLACYHFEAILWAGLLLSLYWLVPDGLSPADLQSAVTDARSWPYWASGCLYLLAMSLIAPFYICAGFSYYLTRRTELEAWDLELAFRQATASSDRGGPGRLGGRRPVQSTGGPRQVSALPAAILTFALVAAAPHGAPRAADLPDRESARNLIAEILSDPDFGRTRKVTVWLPLGTPEASKPPTWLDGLGRFAVVIGQALKWVLLALAVAAVILLARRILHDWRPDWRIGRRKGQARRALTASQTIALEAEPDPSGLAGQVRALFAVGDTRGALALLYRGGLAYLARRGAAVPRGATEGECLRIAAAHLGPGELAPLRELVRAWQGLAYAQQVPDPQAVECALDGWLLGIGARSDAPSNETTGPRDGLDGGAGHAV